MANEPAIQPAYVLHTRRYGDSSLIVECLTRDAGRVPLMARGALGGKKYRQALLQPFTPLLAGWRGRGEIPTLTSLEAAGQPLAIRGKRLFCAIYLNELTQKLTARHDPHIELFADYGQALHALTGDDPVEPVLRCFEVNLLRYLGMGLMLECDAQEQPIRPENRYYYDPENGPRAALMHDKFTCQGETLLALHNADLGDQRLLPEARQLMRRVLDYHLGGRPLKSRELFHR